jgi:hypothetical protein
MVGIHFASGIYEYLTRAIELGAFEGPLGKMEVHPSLKPLIEAMHHVLAGGEVETRIARAGNPDVVQDLDNRLERGRQEANAINKAAGYRVTMAC